jgi:CarboxypepD_reg-like domain
MRYHFIILFVYALGPIASGQDLINIQGKVMDHRTSESLPHASVTLGHHPIGTICNLDGMFNLYIPTSAENDTLQVSMIGYESYRVIVRKIKHDESLTIRLKAAAHYLAEVVVEDTITAEEILKRALKRYKQNYAVSPYTLGGFYREVQQSDDKYVSLVECAVTVFDRGNQKPRKVRLDQLRRTEKFEHPSNTFWDKQNLFLHLFMQDFVVNGPKKVKKNPMKRLPDTFIDNDKIYVIQWVNRIRLIPETLYIRADDYAIIRLFEDYDSTRDGRFDWSVPYSPLLRAHFSQKKLTTSYEKYEGRYYLKSIYISATINYHNKLSGDLFQKFRIDHHFVATQLDLQPDLSTFNNFSHMQLEQSLESIPFRYDPDFWMHYNMIRETPLEEKIRQDLEAKKSLEEQFEEQ